VVVVGGTCEFVGRDAVTGKWKIGKLNSEVAKEDNTFFSMEWFTRKDGLCGCAVKNRHFCFHCMFVCCSQRVKCLECNEIL